MCGIAGWIDWQRSLQDEIPMMKQMCNTLMHRGPDAEGIWQRQHALLGHRRLAVIDLVTGQQPMERTIDSKTYVITYNGELYNTDEVKMDLIRLGYQFETTSDTEVILVAFIEWRERAVERLNGIFAFAIWDENAQTLYAFRDRLGVKPFYYTIIGEVLLFASEIKALLVHPKVSRNVTTSQLASILSLGPSSEPTTTPFQHIYQLAPAHYLVMNQQGMTLHQYWDTETFEHPHDENETAQYLRSLLIDSIERQLVTDVPLCTFLSGGIDSSLITAVAANYYKARGGQLHTYSVDYVDASFQQNDFQTTRDAEWIARMSTFSETVHHNVYVTTEQLLEDLLHTMHLKDMPGMVDIDTSLFVFSKEMKKDFTVALSGECADELFGGYRWFYDDFESFPWIRSLHLRETLLNDAWRQKLNLQKYVKGVYEHTISQMPLFHENIGENKRQQLFYLNRQYFMQTLLQRKDKMTMGTGLEVRVPFADHRLVEYVWNIPWEMKTTGGLEKGILRKAAEGLVPYEVLYRKKNPYPKTYDVRYTEGVRMMLEQCLQQKDSILHELFNREQLNQLLQGSSPTFHEPWYGQLMAGPQLIAYYVQLHHWFEKYNINIVE